jgi:cellulose synthase/poly-beta-1,6-N-acetylglucosamine synthase-like glycosyltransferase
MRWSHINGSYTLTRLQTIMLDGHLWSSKQRAARNFFNFNGTAGIWRREARVERRLQHDTLTEDTDLSFRAH